MGYKFNTTLFLQYYNEGKTDKEMVELLGSSSSAIQAYRSKLGLPFNQNVVKINKIQNSVIIGAILGDSSLFRITNTSFLMCHSAKQKEYFLWKYNILKPFFSGYKVSSKLRKQNNTYYEEIRANSICSLSLNKYHDLFYNDKKRIITLENVKLIDSLALAVLFMDDGGKADCSYNICTQCFTREEVIILSQYLLNTFNIETTINYKNILRIRAKSRSIFEAVISPHVIESMKYKLHNKSL